MYSWLEPYSSPCSFTTWSNLIRPVLLHISFLFHTDCPKIIKVVFAYAAIIKKICLLVLTIEKNIFNIFFGFLFFFIRGKKILKKCVTFQRRSFQIFFMFIWDYPYHICIESFQLFPWVFNNIHLIFSMI